MIHRLLCVRTGRTVSLLPDFCLPRRRGGRARLALVEGEEVELPIAIAASPGL